jgi:7,8-dihydropterin-6-yl-methyl-4-(beta-D-ribofuranosyl)aminobenzene 5'-phosphate synthase
MIMIQITCVVDNAVKRGSSLWGEHGLAFWIEIGRHCVLFDTGQTGEILFHNLEVLGLHLEDLNAVALSHAHLDHTGGLNKVLSHIIDLPVYANADFLRPRYSLHDGQYRSIGLATPLEELTQQADLHLSDSPVEILPALWTTGRVWERVELEGRSPNHFVKVDGEWLPDPYSDDLSLVLDTQDGLIIIAGCCHSGLLNTLVHVQHTYQRSIIAFLGGTHLANADNTYLNHVNKVLRDQFNLKYLYPNHCTGENAFVSMVNAFGSQVNPCPAGTSITFD